jgi:hypothetical protein
MKIATLLAVGAALTLGGCATTYSPESLTGGFSETAVSDTVLRVRFGGNGYTTAETVQTYWLYHCAELALAKGYDAFYIVTPINLTAIQALERADAGQARVIRTRGGGGGGGHGGGRGGRVYTYSYGYAGTMAYKPSLVGDIRLLKKPFTPIPGRLFDAAALKALLGPYVLGPKCNGNVCPHVHSYLFPPLTTPAPLANP